MESEAQQMIDKMVGKKFGKLTVVSFSHSKNRCKYYNCICDCGNKHNVMGISLRRKKRPTKSCGCLQRHIIRNTKRIKCSKGEACSWSLYLSYKRRCKKKAKEFKLNYDLFKNITSQKCYYCGTNPSQEHKLEGTNGSYIYNGIDRVDSNIGYIENNVKPCCKDCNYAKRVMSEEDFAKWIEKVYNNFVINRRKEN